MLLDAKLIMRDGFLHLNPAANLNKDGYAERWEQNLLPGIDAKRVELDLAGKGGSELAGKFKAAHSSTALVVNSFARFRDNNDQVPIPGFGDVQVEGFEKLFPTGLSGTPPHLDATAHNADGLVAIESKCLEYFTPKVAKFRDTYLEKIKDGRRDGPWFAEMLRLRKNPRRYECLDAAQLVKHAFGLAWTVKEGPVVLLYLFWEPDDAEYQSACKQHREEVAELAAAVAGARPAFAFMSYQELWTSWAQFGSAPLSAHAELLMSRYCGRLGSYEGYTRVNGRKTDAGFWDEDDLL